MKRYDELKEKFESLWNETWKALCALENEALDEAEKAEAEGDDNTAEKLRGLADDVESATFFAKGGKTEYYSKTLGYTELIALGYNVKC